ncbi:MAG: glutathione S-transferase C-terminal domain-containing protein [Alphaproteobacteria bacterium]
MGATPENAPVIKESYWRVLRALDGHVRLNRYLFGSRPSLADFGWFGMLKTLATDTTPMMEMREAVPMVEHWARQVDDISGHSPTKSNACNGCARSWRPYRPLPAIASGLCWRRLSAGTCSRLAEHLLADYHGQLCP